jgi:hypothetical protein
MEDELDNILAEIDFSCFDDHIFSLPPTSMPRSAPPTSSRRFAIQAGDELVEAAKHNSIPKNTKRCTNWAIKVWKDWSLQRQQSFPGYEEWPVGLMLATHQQLDYSLSKFVVEVRVRCHIHRIHYTEYVADY